MTLQDSTFHLPRGEAGGFNPFIAKPFRMAGGAQDLHLLALLGAPPFT